MFNNVYTTIRLPMRVKKTFKFIEIAHIIRMAEAES